MYTDGTLDLPPFILFLDEKCNIVTVRKVLYFNGVEGVLQVLFDAFTCKKKYQKRVPACRWMVRGTRSHPY